MPKLFCEAGQHHWERPPKRGRLPRNCPEHLNVAPPPKPLEKALDVRRKNSKTKREQKIEDILTANPQCRCGITPDMTAEQLRYVRSCVPNWICSCLNNVRIATKMWDELNRERDAA